MTRSAGPKLTFGAVFLAFPIAVELTSRPSPLLRPSVTTTSVGACAWSYRERDDTNYDRTRSGRASAELGMQDGQPGRKEWRGRRTSTSINGRRLRFFLLSRTIASSCQRCDCFQGLGVLHVAIDNGGHERSSLTCCCDVVMKSRKDLPEACHSAETILQASRVRAPFPPGSSSFSLIWSLISAITAVDSSRSRAICSASMPSSSSGLQWCIGIRQVDHLLHGSELRNGISFSAGNNGRHLG